MDQETFYLNLTAVIEDSAVAEWESEYSMLEYFNLTELSPVELSSLLLDVKSHITTLDLENNLSIQMKSDRAVFDKYYRVNTVQYEAATPDNCDEKCQLFHFCAQYELNYARFESCVGAGQINNRSNLTALPGLLVSVVLLIVMSFMVD